MQTSYSATYRDLWTRHWWWQARHQLVMRTLAQVCDHDNRSAGQRRLIDIGCAGGVAFEDFSQFGLMHGIEPDAGLIDHSSSWADCIDVTMFDANYSATTEYDVVLMLDVLEHIEDDTTALTGVFDMLRPGGAAILTVPALPSLWSVHDEINHHFRRYTRNSLTTGLSQAGFEITQVRHVFGWSLGLMYLRRLLASREPSSYDVKVPMRPVNAAMRWLTRCEEWLCRTLRCSPPSGSSLLAVVRRPQRTVTTVSPPVRLEDRFVREPVLVQET